MRVLQCVLVSGGASALCKGAWSGVCMQIAQHYTEPLLGWVCGLAAGMSGAYCWLLCWILTLTLQPQLHVLPTSDSHADCCPAAACLTPGAGGDVCRI